jgi:hypothetical protein
MSGRVEFVIDESVVSVDDLVKEYGMTVEDWDVGKMSGRNIYKEHPAVKDENGRVKAKAKKVAYFYWAAAFCKWVLFYDGCVNDVIYSMIRKGYITEYRVEEE